MRNTLKFVQALRDWLALTQLLLLSLLISTTAYAYGPAPDFTLNDLNGKSVSLAQFKGDLVYVDFWATWCGPCRESFPWMEQMKQKYQGLGFHILAISIDGKREIIDRFLENQQISFTVLRDEKSKTATAYEVSLMPSSFIVDGDGYIQYSHQGFRDSDKSILEQKFRALLLN